jgi:hypothetical protein
MQKEPIRPKINSFQIGIIFLVQGITLLVVSILLSEQIVLLIGLGLTFWGALFLLIPPPKQIESSYLVTSSLPGYMNIDRMLNSLLPKNEAYNIPPFPSNVSLPQHLKGLKDAVTFIPSIYTNGIAEIEDIAKGKFLIDKPKGLLITSPGISILEKIEKKQKTDFTKIPPSELDEVLPVSFGLLYLAEEIELTTTSENEVHISIRDSLYRNLYSPKYCLKSIKLLGCPLVNAAACAIAKSTGNPILIQQVKVTSKGKKITAVFNVVQSKREQLDLGQWGSFSEEAKSKVLEEQPVTIENNLVPSEEAKSNVLEEQPVTLESNLVHSEEEKPNVHEEPPVTLENNLILSDEAKLTVLEQTVTLENDLGRSAEKPHELLVTKAEIFDNTLRFFVKKGFLKKRLITVKEIPVNEITDIESYRNTLTVTWKGAKDTFLTMENPELFNSLRDRVKTALEEQEIDKDTWKSAIRRNEILAVLDASVGIIDFSFNILIGIHRRQIDWQRLSDYSSGDLLNTFSFTGQFMPPLNFDFMKISLVIENQNVEETSKEAYDILKVIYNYFDNLSVTDDLKESVPNFVNAKAIILSYYTLNYLLLGKVAGEKDNTNEYNQLKSVLELLDNDTNFKVNIETLKASMDKVIPENYSENEIAQTREIFKNQFLLLVYQSL